MGTLTDPTLVNIDTIEPGDSGGEPARTLVIGAGGTGSEIATWLCALCDGDPAVAFIAVDVMASPPALIVPSSGTARVVRLERDLQYIRIGVDLDPARVRETTRGHPARRRALAALLGRLPPGVTAQSLEIGTQAERALAAAAFTWSLPELDVAVERSLRRLSDVRLSDRDGRPIHNARVNVLIIASTAGGVGSATALPLAGLVKDVMDRLGLPRQRSLFTLALVGPDAFAETRRRLSNGFEALRDIEAAQRRGVVPVDGLTARYGAPSEVIFAFGTATADGTLLHADRELFPIAAQALRAWLSPDIGQQAAAMANNLLGLLHEETEDGELMMLGSAGYHCAVFDGEEVVRSHGAAALMGAVLAAWAAADDPAAAAVAEADAASVHHCAGENELLGHARKDEHGAPLLVQFDDAVGAVWQRRKPRPGRVPVAIVELEAAYRERMTEALAAARASQQADLDGYVQRVLAAARGLVNTSGPQAGLTLTALALARLDGIKGAISEQRAGLAEEAAAAELAAAVALQELDAAVAAGGRLFAPPPATKPTLDAKNTALDARWLFDLTEVAIAEVSRAREPLAAFQTRADELVTVLRDAAAALAATARAYEAAVPQPADELLRRRLHDARDLHALYELACGCPWGTTSPQLDAVLRLAAGKLEQWLGLGAAEVRARALAAAAPRFSQVAAMTADDFVRWKCGRTGRPPELALRDLLDLAPLLCRYDRARMPELHGVQQTAFALVGVPDRDASVFAGTSQDVLVTTGDRTRLSVLRLGFGMPASALWGYERMRRAFATERRLHPASHDIYPGLHDPGRGRRRGGRRRS